MKLIDVLVKQANGEIKEGSRLFFREWIFKFVRYNFEMLSSNKKLFDIANITSTAILNSEVELIEPNILTDKEKEYLSNVIRPFKGRVENITKCENKNGEFVCISLKDEAGMPFPYFEKNTIYKGMELDKRYTLRELGLEEQ